jgi:uncharacterized membrane protein YczE
VPVSGEQLTTTRPYRPRSATSDWANRLGRCVVGLAIFGVGIACILHAHLGAAPWDVFHQGVSELTGIPIGRVIVITGLALLVVWIPLRQRPGIGTLLNAVVIGISVDLVIDHVPEPDHLLARVALLAIGLGVIGLGSAMYIGSGLGAGPRDGIMMGLAARGLSVRVARTVIEAVVLVAGLLLGGSVGIGTLAFTFGIGPIVQALLPRFLLPPRAPIDRVGRVSSGSGRS